MYGEVDLRFSEPVIIEGDLLELLHLEIRDKLDNIVESKWKLNSQGSDRFIAQVTVDNEQGGISG